VQGPLGAPEGHSPVDDHTALSPRAPGMVAGMGVAGKGSPEGWVRAWVAGMGRPGRGHVTAPTLKSKKNFDQVQKVLSASQSGRLTMGKKKARTTPIVKSVFSKIFVHLN